MRDEELDKILERGLTSYSTQEPRPGLEQRILQRMAAERKRPAPWRWWALVTACLAGFAYALAVMPRNTPRPPAASAALVLRAGVPRRVYGEAAKPPVPERKISKRPVRYRALPRRQQFPTPTPISGEERALIGLVNRDPQLARELFTEPEPQPIEPIRIPQIQIEPLPAEGLQ